MGQGLADAVVRRVECNGFLPEKQFYLKIQIDIIDPSYFFFVGSHCSSFQKEPAHYGLRYVSKHAEVLEVDDDQVVSKTSYYSPVLKVCLGFLNASDCIFRCFCAREVVRSKSSTRQLGR